MAVEFDAFSEATADTGNLSWTHTPSGTPKGVVVLIVQNATQADQVSGVTYGGDSMSELAGSPFLTPGLSSEPSTLYAYFLGSGLSSGAQTVVVTVTGGADKTAGAATITAGADTEVEDTTTFEHSGGGGSPSLTLTTGAGVECFCFGTLHAGKGNPDNLSPGADYTELADHDFGAQSCQWQRRTNDSTGGNVTMDWSVSGATQDESAFGVAVTESAPSGQTISKNLQDTLTFADQVSRDFWGDRLLNDVSTFADQIASGAIRDRALQDSLAFSDQVVRTLDIDRELQDIATFTDQIVRTGVYDRELQETFTFAESLGIDVGRDVIVTRTLQDLLSFDDQLQSARILSRAQQEVLSFSDQVIRTVVNDRILQDSNILSENLTHDKVLDRQLQDSLSFADQIVRRVIRERLLQDSFTFGDQILRDLVLDRYLSDVFSFVDNLDYTSTGAPPVVTKPEHWRLFTWHKWAIRRRMWRKWMDLDHYPPS